ncbi:predicted protein [Naegleria gruberi]|uniref:Predicted protein n=1 Tax=Naegleria gruberi TaxID=5762 RepID=D2VFU9_NAEGR|nr:uncharacterized protein NAEGRDRAFT_67751 [Naegleria gruberi]EFC44252.1 predicted protein [Naegleria gruberi]|eukprot:XP_002676996.1 predicted protein [Naegleria gruberi strain NEG-M]
MIHKFSIVEFYQPNKSAIKEEHLPSKRGRKTRVPKRGEMRVVSTDKLIQQVPSSNGQGSPLTSNSKGAMSQMVNAPYSGGDCNLSNRIPQNEQVSNVNRGKDIERPISLNFPFNYTMHAKQKDISMPLIPTIPKIEKTSKTKTHHPQRAETSSLQRKIIRTSISIQELLN